MRLIFFILLFLAEINLALSASKIGDTPYDEVGKTNAGEEIKISDHKGKVVIVTFWATWCGPCMKELPVLSAIQKSAGTDNLQVIAVNYKESRRHFKKIADALADSPMKVTSDVKGRIGRKFDVKGIPHMLIINRQGKIASVHIGYGEDSLPNLIDEINDAGRESDISESGALDETESQ